MRVNQRRSSDRWLVGFTLLLLAVIIWWVWWMINYPGQPPPGW